jgi:hypothetical protein
MSKLTQHPLPDVYENSGSPGYTGGYYTEDPTPPPSVKPLAVVVICHAKYLDRLHNTLSSIDKQFGRHKRVLVLDSCTFEDVPDGWQVIHVDHRCPNRTRNAGLQTVVDAGAVWCVFWDADNIMPVGYLDHVARRTNDAARDVGILSPDVIRVENGHARFSVRQPDTRDFWSGRTRSLSDTSSAWRVEAVLQAGGFPQGNTMLDDYTLALNVTALGWVVDKLDAPVLLQDHDSNRSTHGERGESDLWNNRNYHIITPLAGRVDVLRAWSASVHGMDLPPKTHITLVNDSGCLRFAKDIWDEAESLSHLVNVKSVKVLDAPAKLAPVEGWEAIHRRVAMLYNLALAGDRSDMVLFWEDDVIPTNTKALRYLAEGFLPFTRLAGVGGCYPARCNNKVAVASLERSHWGRMPRLDWLSHQQHRVQVGMLGGGFTLWAGHYLNKALPLRVEPDNRLGWDGSLGSAFNAEGLSLWLDPRVVCEHRCA